MLKTHIQGPPIQNVTQGQSAILNLDAGPRYHAVPLIATVTKTAPAAGFTSATLSDVLGLLQIKVNTKMKRQHTAQELNEVQTAWDFQGAAILYDKQDNNFNAVADSTNTYNSISCTTRVSTWVLVVNFAEPCRDSFLARELYAWPTTWIKNGTVVQTANIQMNIAVPNTTTAGLTRANINTTMSAGYQLMETPVIRGEVVFDAGTGVFDAQTGLPVMPGTQWYRDNLIYSSTNFMNRIWSFLGNINQMSIFSPDTSGDDVWKCTLKRTPVGGSVTNIFDGSKKVRDGESLVYGWNPYHLGITTGDATGTNWHAADVFHLAMDFDDTPTNFLPFNQGDVLELDLTLYQATASQKNLIVISQVYNDMLTN